MQGAASSEYTFAEPLIEEAVRKQLNIADTEPVTEADLEKVVSLHIFGLQIYSSEDEIYFQGAYPYVYNSEMQESGLYEQTGTISSLEDITHMPNLRTLCLYRQQITDISVLADESLGITELGLGYNSLTDLSPLTGNNTIVYLNLAALSISDDTVTEVISTMSSLQTLNISSTGIRSLNGLENCPITDLNIFDVELDNYTELALLEGLTDLEISYLTGSIVQALTGLPLKSLIVHNPNGYSLEVLSALADLEYLCVYDPYMSTFTFGQVDLPSLKTLEIKNTVITDFYDLAALDSLSTLMIYSCECESYDGLDALSGLSTICCTEEQANAIRAEYPDADYFYSY
ncbi:MAG: hypothetical protein LUF30_05175 [Lachnospiraceae bacterium]|nr:hypothetical protein [Lachnospiraceae bacterium]